MARKPNILKALEAFSSTEFQGIIKAKRLLDQKAKLGERRDELSQGLRRVQRGIRKLERKIAKAVRAGGRLSKGKRRRTAKKRTTGSRGAVHKGKLRGLRPNSMASRIVGLLKKAKDRRARVMEIAAGLAALDGKRDAKTLMHFVSAVLSSNRKHFKRVSRGVYALAGKS